MVIAITMSYTIFTHAGSNKTGYVAFGDSIAAGYGLEGYTADQDNPPADSYQAIISNFLKTSPANYAVTGEPCGIRHVRCCGAGNSCASSGLAISPFTGGAWQIR